MCRNNGCSTVGSVVCSGVSHRDNTRFSTRTYHSLIMAGLFSRGSRLIARFASFVQSKNSSFCRMNGIPMSGTYLTYAPHSPVSVHFLLLFRDAHRGLCERASKKNRERGMGQRASEIFYFSSLQDSRRCAKNSARNVLPSRVIRVSLVS